MNVATTALSLVIATTALAPVAEAAETNKVQLTPFQVTSLAYRGSFGEAGYTRFVGQASATGDASQTNGRVGRINGIELYASNQASLLVPSSGSGQTAVTAHSVHYFFDRRDWAMVIQVNKTEAYRPEKRFMDAVKGLTNYGGKVLNSSRMSKWTTNT